MFLFNPAIRMQLISILFFKNARHMINNLEKNRSFIEIYKAVDIECEVAAG